MKPHTTTGMLVKVLGELVALVGGDAKLRQHRDLAALVESSANLLLVVNQPDLPRSRAMRLGMQIAADGCTKPRALSLLRAIQEASEMSADDGSKQPKREARPRRTAVG